jgi:1,2-phenylacetyl-CoA epoxidase PaaB subunit
VSAPERVFEVFLRGAGEDGCRHVGSVLAATTEAALVFAHEQFGRRGAWREIWVAPRDAIGVLDASAVPGPAFDRSYRSIAGYRDVQRRWREVGLAEARRREGLRS